MIPVVRPSLAELRPDLRAVANLVGEETRVLDLGCGDGALLDYLVHNKAVQGRGIELGEESVLACVRRGLSVRQGNLTEGLADYPDGSFDAVILSQTLQYLDDPAMILGEMLRVGRRAIVSFPNWGHWRSRLSLLLRGHIPAAPDFPEPWHSAPRWQALTIADFRRFCEIHQIAIVDQAFLSGARSGQAAPNLLARTALFALQGTSAAA